MCEKNETTNKQIQIKTEELNKERSKSDNITQSIIGINNSINTIKELINSKEQDIRSEQIQINATPLYRFYNQSDNLLDIKNKLTENQKGLSNIFKLQELANDNFYYKPRINMEMLQKHNEGLICTTACIANQVAQYFLKGEKILAHDTRVNAHPDANQYQDPC